MALSLGAGLPTGESEIDAGLRWLLERLNRNGALTLEGDSEPHWTTSLFVLTLAKLGFSTGSVSDRLVPEASATGFPRADAWGTDRIRRSVEWLLTWEGRRAAPQKRVVLDSTLAGWPWMSETFSWVEPTSYALLAIKLCGRRNHPRVAEAERLLLDRACQDGGWNYGNHTVFGARLVGFVPTTALAALALQDVDRASDTVNRALAFLDREIKARQSTLSLALTLLCFDVFGQPTANLAEALGRRQASDGSWRQQIHLTALALLALEAASGGINGFELSRGSLGG